MAVVIETTLGDITVDLYIEQRPRASQNFLKLCKLKYYNFNLFHSIRSNFIAQTGDPTGEGSGGSSVWGVIEGPDKRYFACEKIPKIRHTDAGLLSMVVVDDTMVGSQFFFTLAPNLDSLDSRHCVIGEVVEGHEVLRKLNEVICDETHRPYRDVRITHTIILEDPFNDMPSLRAPSRSPSPSAERLAGDESPPDEEINETKDKTVAEVAEMVQEKEAKARATILEIVGDLPDADMAPPENVLFVCKLNPVTTDEDLEIIFSRFGKIIGCEVIRDKKTGDSLQYAFIEFEDKKSCENAYFKMDNVLIDDRRIHVDFSQSVSKLKWRGKGKGVIHVENEEGNQNGNDKFKNNELERNTSQRRKHSREEHRHSEHDSSQSQNRDSNTDRIHSRSRDNRDHKTKESNKRKHGNNDNREQYHHKHRRRENPYHDKRDVDQYRNHSSERKSSSGISSTTDRKKTTDNSSKLYDDKYDKRSKGTHSKNEEKTRLSYGNSVDRLNRKHGNSYRSKRSQIKCEDSSYRSLTPPPPSCVKHVDSSKSINNKKGTQIKEKSKTKEQKTKKSKKRTSSSSSSDSSDDSSSSSSSSDSSNSTDRKKRSRKRNRKYSTSSSSSSSSSTSSSDSSSSAESTSSSSDSSDSNIKSSKKKKQNKKSRNFKKNNS